MSYFGRCSQNKMNNSFQVSLPVGSAGRHLSSPGRPIISRCSFCLIFLPMCYVRKYGIPRWSIEEKKPCSAPYGGGGMVGYPETEQLLNYILFRVAPKRLFWIETDTQSLRWFQRTGIFKGKISHLQVLSVPSKRFFHFFFLPNLSLVDHKPLSL